MKPRSQINIPAVGTPLLLPWGSQESYRVRDSPLSLNLVIHLSVFNDVDSLSSTFIPHQSVCALS